MRKLMIAMLALAVVFGFAACDNSNSGSTSLMDQYVVALEVTGPTQYFAGDKLDADAYTVTAVQNDGQKVTLAAGDYEIENKIPVKDTLFKNRTDFNLDSLAFVPFSQGDSIKMDAVVKTVSGVKVPLFEASLTYKSLLKGLDNQLRINLDASEKEKNEKKYGTADFSGLKVGSVTAPNNNAGNWE